MSDNQDLDHEIVEHLYGELSRKDQKSFEDRCKGDESLNKDVSQIEDTLMMYRKLDRNQEKMPAEISAKILAVAKQKALDFKEEHEKRELHLVDDRSVSKVSTLDRITHLLQPLLRPSFAFAATVLLVLGLTFFVKQETKKSPALLSQANRMATVDKETRVARLAQPKKKQDLAKPSRSANENRRLPVREPAFVSNPVAAAPTTQFSDNKFSDNTGTSDFNSLSNSNTSYYDDNDSYYIELPLQMVSRPNFSQPDPIPSFPMNVQQEFAKAQHFASLRQYPQALQSFQNVAELAPNSIESTLSHHQSARIQSDAGNLEKAAMLYETILSSWPNYVHLDQVLWESANLYIEQSQWHDAHLRLQQLHNQFPQHRKMSQAKIQFVKDHL